MLWWHHPVLQASVHRSPRPPQQRQRLRLKDRKVPASSMRIRRHPNSCVELYQKRERERERERRESREREREQRERAKGESKGREWRERVEGTREGEQEMRCGAAVPDVLGLSIRRGMVWTMIRIVQFLEGWFGSQPVLELDTQERRRMMALRCSQVLQSPKTERNPSV